MSNIKVLKKITDKEFSKLLKTWEGKELDTSIEDLGFCIKAELSAEELKELEEIHQKIHDLCGEEHSMSCCKGIETINGIEVPKEWTDRKNELMSKQYSSFEYAQPGYVEDTMKIAKEHDAPLEIPKGSKMYYSYPLSCVVVVEITKDLKTTSEFIEAFCDGYNEIYTLEEESTKKKAMPIYEEDPSRPLVNRNATDGCFGIWGHDIGDLVLEDITFYKDGDILQIDFFIGS